MNQPEIDDQSTSGQHRLTTGACQIDLASARNDLELALSQAIRYGKGRSQMALLRAWFDVLENARINGVSRAVIVQELSRQGLDIKPRNYSSLMSRIRKERAKEECPGPKLDLPNSPANPKPGKPLANSQKVHPMTQARIAEIKADTANLDEYL